MADREHWQQIEAILDEVLELPEATRLAFLDRRGLDPLLREEVDALLAADRDAGAFLDSPAAEYLPSLAEGLAAEAESSKAESSKTSSSRTRKGLSWVGRPVGPYRIQREVGSGGMGEVYEAYDSRLERTVALKRVQLGRISPCSQEASQDSPGKDSSSKDSVLRQRFRREARLAAALSHPAIVRIHDILEEGGEDWLVMEYLEGRSLAAVLQEGPLAEQQALAWAEQLTAGLAAAHRRGIIHRDLKAQNVLITVDGDAKLLDFGLAKRFAEPLKQIQETALTGDQQVLGTLGAMSPEQARGQELDPRSDLFSLGSLLYEMVTGESPFWDPNPAVTLTRICSHPPPSPRAKNPALSPLISELIEGLLEKDPNQRPQRAEEILQVIRGGEASRRRIPASRCKAAVTPVLAPILVTGLVLVISVVLAGWWFWGRTPPPPRYVAVTMPEVIIAGGDGLDKSQDQAAGGATDGVTPRLAGENRREAEERAEDQLLASSIHAALQQGLSQLQGLAAVTTAGLESVPASSLATARALGAVEALTARLSCLTSRCQVTLSRLAVADGQVLGLAAFDVPKNNLAFLRTAVLSRLRQAYPGFRTRSGAISNISSDGYRRFLELSDAYQTHGPLRGEALIEALERLRRQEPQFLEVHLLEANVARESFYSSRDKKWLDHSLDLLDRAGELAPRDPRVPANLFDIAAESEQWDLAGEALADLQALEPGGSEALQREARLLVHRGQGARALELMRGAADLQPAQYRLFNLALMEYQEGQVSAARRTLERLLERSPSYHKARSLLAQLELLSGSPARAVELFEGLVDPETAGSEDSNLGTAYLLTGRFEAAAWSFQRAYDQQPGNAIVALNLADARSLEGDQESAQALYLLVLELLEQDTELARWQRLTVGGQALAHLGRQREAAAAVQEAGRIAPDNPQVALESALVYTLTGDLNISLVQVEKALTMGLGPHWFRLPWFAPLEALPSFRELAG
ncbi:MAG: protein kinase [Deltaproteobacteria bacterium]|nr:protein kinase [Deltaproteobacteria bacterium]